VLSTAVVTEASNGYDVVIGENPNGDGHIALYLLGSTVVSAVAVETIGETIEEEREEQQGDQEEAEKTDEEEANDAPGREESWRLSERQKLWIRAVGDFALDVYRASEIVDEIDDDDDEEDDSTEMETTVFDMANGQSTLIEVPADGRDQTLLVGAGSNPRIANTPWDEYRGELTDQLEINSNGEYVIDYLVVSHNHTDHISYVDDILDDDAIVVRNLYFNGIKNGISAEDDINNAVTSSMSTDVLREGDQFSVGEATVDVLNPDSSADEIENNPRSIVMDRNSIVLHVQHDSGDILTTGDIRSMKEGALADNFGSQLSSVDILMASHHGTSSSSESVVTDEILDVTSPRVVIISNSNQMSTSQTDRYAPDCAVFNRAGDRNLPIYWTAVHREIQFTGGSFSGAEAQASVSNPDELQSRFLLYDC